MASLRFVGGAHGIYWFVGEVEFDSFGGPLACCVPCAAFSLFHLRCSSKEFFHSCTACRWVTRHPWVKPCASKSDCFRHTLFNSFASGGSLGTRVVAVTPSLQVGPNMLTISSGFVDLSGTGVLLIVAVVSPLAIKMCSLDFIQKQMNFSSSILSLLSFDLSTDPFPWCPRPRHRSNGTFPSGPTVQVPTCFGDGSCSSFSHCCGNLHHTSSLRMATCDDPSMSTHLHAVLSSKRGVQIPFFRDQHRCGISVQMPMIDAQEDLASYISPIILVVHVGLFHCMWSDFAFLLGILQSSKIKSNHVAFSSRIFISHGSCGLSIMCGQGVTYSGQKSTQADLFFYLGQSYSGQAYLGQACSIWLY